MLGADMPKPRLFTCRMQRKRIQEKSFSCIHTIGYVYRTMDEEGVWNEQA